MSSAPAGFGLRASGPGSGFGSDPGSRPGSWDCAGFQPGSAPARFLRAPSGRPTPGTFNGDVPVVLVRQGQRIYALADTCAHLGGPLSEGTLEHGTIACPWHGSTYALEDGRVLRGPATHPQPVFECRIRGGQIEIRMPRRRQPAETERTEREDQHRAAS